MSQLGALFPYIMKKQQMFQTTNQLLDSYTDSKNMFRLETV